MGEVTSITINEQNKEIVFTVANWRRKHNFKLPIETTQVTYKMEIGAGGTIGPCLKVVAKGQILFKIKSGITGWSDSTLNAIASKVLAIHATNKN